MKAVRLAACGIEPSDISSVLKDDAADLLDESICSFIGSPESGVLGRTASFHSCVVDFSPHSCSFAAFVLVRRETSPLNGVHRWQALHLQAIEPSASPKIQVSKDA